MRFTPWTVVSLVLLLAGIVFYLWMGLSFGRWTDVGVYAVTIVLAGLGAAGAFVAGTGNTDASA